MKKRGYVLFLAVSILVPLGIAVIYVCHYYRADSTAAQSLLSDADVTVTRIQDGWLFDGPSNDTALIFYPGAKVEETAYAPMLHLLAGKGADVILVKMPFRLAILGINKAEKIQRKYSYDKWYIGGHSMGGAMAALYAAGFGERLDGLILCAAYAAKPLDSGLTVLTIYGSEDKVLNMDRFETGKRYLPADASVYEIVGGNHSQFGNYGIQSGDGTAGITTDVQQEETVEFIVSAVLTSAGNESSSHSEMEQPLHSPDDSMDAQEQQSGSAADFDLYDADGNETNYILVYHDEEFTARYTEDNWKIIDSYKITDTEDMTAICQALLDIHPVHGRDMRSVRTAEDMAFEWMRHNIAYELLPDESPWKKNAKDVDLNPADQNRTLPEMYEDRTGREFHVEDFLKQM